MRWLMQSVMALMLVVIASACTVRNNSDATVDLPVGPTETALLAATPVAPAPTPAAAATPGTRIATPAPATRPASPGNGGAVTAEAPAVLVGAGDIASCASTGDEATAALLDAIPGTIFTTGDNAQDDASAADFNDCYDPSWGRFKARTRPAPGNREYSVAGAAPYYDYFGQAAGEPSKGYYSYDLNRYWHAIVLNSNCAEVGGCSAGSQQYQWLEQDLRDNRTSNIVAYWHHPRFSSGTYGNMEFMNSVWKLLNDYNVDVVVNSDDHDYERFAPIDGDGNRNDARGIREFIIGTGGTSVREFGEIQPYSEVRQSDTFGVLKLTLYPDRYEWQFIPVAGKTFSDAGSSPVH